LVHAGKYAEAQQLTTGLLLAYPNDERLLKAKALLEKLLTSPASATPGNNQPTNNGAPGQPAASANAANLTGIDKVDYDALIELARQAQQTTDLEPQKTLLKQFMDQSSVFLQKHPNEMLLWQLRAASAMSLNDDPMAGYEAGQKLLAADAADSNDPNVRRLLAQLKNKGWLDKEAAEKAKEHQRYISVTFEELAASDNSGGSFTNLRKLLDRDVTALLKSRFPRINSRINTPDDGVPPLRVTINVHKIQIITQNRTPMIGNDLRYTVNSELLISVSSPAGLRVDRPFALTIVKDIMYNTFHPLVKPSPTELATWVEQEVMGKFQSVLDEDAVRKSLPNPIDQEVQHNAEAAKSSPAIAAALAHEGHELSPEEVAKEIKARRASRCAVVTNPGGAEVYIDGNLLGVTPIAFTLKKYDAPRVISIKLAEYKAVEKQLNPDGKDIPIDLTLKKEQ
jgi:PEGA domain